MRLCFICSIVKWAVNPRRWVNYFVEKGYDVHVIGHGEVDIPGAKMRHLTTISKVNFITGPIQTRRIIRKIKPDIVHALGVTPFGFYGALSGFHPFIVSAWGSDIAEIPEKSPILKLMVKYVLKKADVVHTGGGEPGKIRVLELGCAEEKIFVHTNAIDVNRFSPKARSESLRKRLGINDKYSVFLGRRLEPGYNVDVFIKAIPEVLERIDNVMFLLGGTGPLEPKMRKLARDLGVSEHVIFIGGIPNEKMHEYLASVDVYVDTFHGSERGGQGMGMTTYEAMACETPQLLADRVFLRSSDLVRGLIYNPLDSEDLAKKIIFLLKNKDVRNKIGKNSRDVVLKNANFEKIMKKWENVYQNLVA